MGSGTDRVDTSEPTGGPRARLRDGREPGDDLVPALVLVAIGVLVPLLVAARYEPHLRMYVNSKEYSILSALGVGLAFWLCVEGLDLDRVTVLGTAIIAPVPLTFAAGLLAAALGGRLVDSFVFAEFLPYALAIAAAGALAVGLSLVTEALVGRHSRLPERRTVALAVGTTALFGIGAGTGVRYANPSPASIEDVRITYSGSEASLGVFFDTDSSAHHIAVVAPDGTIARERPADAAVERDWTKIRIAQPRGSLYRGQFQVRIATFLGTTVDSTSIGVETGPVPSIRGVETDTSRPNEIDVTAVVGNDGDVTGKTVVDLRGPENDELERTIDWIDPVEPVTAAFTLRRDAIETDRADIVVTTRLERGDTEYDRQRVDLSEG
ncbi:hypothetical protein [Natrinema caseinilyticum]|uniref:hypothetical protein n=1 Tax=Natrinema caseinilyticum TaxID=2961570 RepID=UPI0020C30D7E|nr:hypothetical protein [Natrinema caseinilyticum]